MYLDVNPYVPTLNSIVFMSDRDGSQNLYLMSLSDGSFVQLTNHDDIDASHSGISPATEEVFFREGQTVKKVSLRAPYEEEEVYTVDDQYEIKGSLSMGPGGNKFALSLYNKNGYSTLATIDTARSTLEEVRKIKGAVDHVLINPVYGNTLLYHTYDRNQIGLVNIETKQEKVLTKPGDHGTHPFWEHNGQAAGYVLKNAREARGSQEKVVTYSIQAAGYSNYPLTRYSNHVAMNPSGTWIQGDGGPSDRYIYYYVINPRNNTVARQTMFKHDSTSSNELWHPHATFINDTDVIFNSDKDNPGKSGDIYLLSKNP
ncbi:hypothetical protein [Amycolatopsis sp. SID8362]|uniref:hypothetical protein n=1 Tax=Amycolatopsis sp. SID8362 TaxID=2690346 RepID=UPI00136A0342|nr:hypothetical protein [Amycolatopsis sp. SID8362]NBH09520.1 hypothetical protein [Amycolatopsis sp. SID8362]NED46212.1 hypothetical protein [Amycolatopsis sp. SID8362]